MKWRHLLKTKKCVRHVHHKITKVKGKDGSELTHCFEKFIIHCEWDRRILKLTKEKLERTSYSIDIIILEKIQRLPLQGHDSYVHGHAILWYND